MRKMILAASATAIASLLVVASAAASDQSDAVAAVNQWNDNFNKGDMKAFFAACAPNVIILDEFAPFTWKGPKACPAWIAADDANNKQLGSTSGVMTIGKTLHVTVTGDRAYVVVAAAFTDKEKGKTVTQPAIWTVTLQKVGTGWSVTGSAWSQTTP